MWLLNCRRFHTIPRLFTGRADALKKERCWFNPASLFFALKLHGCFIESTRAFCYAFSMDIKLIKRLILCGLSPTDALLACDEFVRRYGWHDLEAFVKSYEVTSCGKNTTRIRQADM